MDDIDQRQQEELNRLHERAEKNRTVDILQWVAILGVLVAVLAYFNIVLIGAINSQADSIRKIVATCEGKRENEGKIEVKK